MRKENPWRSIWTSLKVNRKGLFQLWAVVFCVHVLSLTLGITVWLIVFGF
jgi:hypothetical protein